MNHLKIAAVAIAAALATSAHAASFTASAGLVNDRIAGPGAQLAASVNLAAYANDPSLPLAVHADALAGIGAIGNSLDSESVGAGLYERAGAWTVEPGVEIGREHVAGQSANHWAGTLRAAYQVNPSIALTGKFAFGRSDGLLGGTYGAAGLGMAFADVKGGQVSVTYQHVRDGSLPGQNMLGVSYAKAF